MYMEQSSVSGRELVNAVAGPWTLNDNRKSRFARAAERAGITPRAVRAVYYGEIDSWTARSVRALETAAKRSANSTRERLSGLAAALRESCDADFYSLDLGALDDVISALGRMVGSKE